MATSVFMKADEVQELLGVSRSEAYRIMKKLNDDLKEKGFIASDSEPSLVASRPVMRKPLRLIFEPSLSNFICVPSVATFI